LYSYNGALRFYPAVASAPISIAASNYVQVVLTRDASSNVVGYVNGVQQFSFVDSQNYSTLAGSPQRLRFFRDDTSENAPGAVARIRLYDRVMPPAQVALLDRLPSSGPAPLEFVQPMYYSNQVMYLTLRVTPNFTYAIQASTNLHDWLTITNVTSTTPLILISDPEAINHSHRFYRGVALEGAIPAAPPRLGTPSINGGAVYLPAQLTPGYAYRLQASTNTVDWLDVSTNTPTASPFTFTDPAGFISGRWFYRLVVP
jgi:hypothetical protein